MKTTKAILEKKLSLEEEANRVLKHRLDESEKALRISRENDYDNRQKIQTIEKRIHQLKTDNIIDRYSAYNTCLTLIKYVNSENNTHRQKRYHCDRASIILAMELDELKKELGYISSTSNGLPF